MRQRMEMPRNPREEQLGLDMRTDKELTESILKKRRDHLPLDQKELELVARQIEEEHRDTEDLYHRKIR
jgi:DNA-binding protein H-NS